MFLVTTVVACGVAGGLCAYRHYERVYAPEFRVACDVPDAVLYVNSRRIGTTPVRLGKPDEYLIRTREAPGTAARFTFAPGREGADLYTRAHGVLRLECSVPDELAPQFACYKRDNRFWLKLDKVMISGSSRNEKSTLLLSAAHKTE